MNKFELYSNFTISKTKFLKFLETLPEQIELDDLIKLIFQNKETLKVDLLSFNKGLIR
jgi:hypothetical protein